ncbi:MBL fold metallo-hydrolase [Nocardiopsis xinjiangensis]|uniref:MBL fold metallo-hydrolase n=1 Tax=Nocardiopsis xinjiangensis TaxID=124285 RepID=UPI000345E4A7|nr:MBL fold metallo-hydrolase [Nocardiopsis xinjiangensis]
MDRIHRITDDVFLVRGTAVNWILLREGRDLTLVDAGYPRDLGLLLASVEQLGHRIEDLRGVLITHAHVDHIGALPELLRRHPAPVYAHPDEVALLRGEKHEQASTWDVVSRSWRPRFARWALTVARAGARTHVRIPEAVPFPGPGPLDLPGRPSPVPCPGHTSGHTAYELADAGTVLTGDALITAHPLSGHSGPQLLPAFFTHDTRASLAALDALRGLGADTVVPGHGPVWRGPVAKAVDAARAHAPQGYRGRQR